MKIRVSAITDVGIVRTNNEDAVLVCPNLEKQNWGETESKDYLSLGKYGAMLVVADGMGGANAGEIASSIAIDTVKTISRRTDLARANYQKRRLMVCF